MPEGDEPAYRAVNRAGWDVLGSAGRSSLDAADFGDARAWLDPSGWLPWAQVRTVLCLASGGGLQGPLFASLGYDVTVADISVAQLRHDREVALERGLRVECLQGDMLDLRELHGRDFDLVYQPVSSCYVPDVTRLYREVASVIGPGGLYLAEHWVSAQIQLDDRRWDGSAYRLVHPVVRAEPLEWRSSSQIGGRVASCLHYLHPLGRLLGGLCEAGFVIEQACEPVTGSLTAPPGSDDHLAAYIPPFLRLLARRRAA